MNTENLNRAINALKAVDPADFNMNDICACIAGHLCDQGVLDIDKLRDSAPLTEFLDIHPYLARAITHPPLNHPAWNNATPAHAIRLLEILRDEGVVNWSQAMGIEPPRFVSHETTSSKG